MTPLATLTPANISKSQYRIIIGQRGWRSFIQIKYTEQSRAATIFIKCQSLYNSWIALRQFSWELYRSCPAVRFWKIAVVWTEQIRSEYDGVRRTFRCPRTRTCGTNSVRWRLREGRGVRTSSSVSWFPVDTGRWSSAVSPTSDPERTERRPARRWSPGWRWMPGS